jgi:hypothetical protein
MGKLALMMPLWKRAADPRVPAHVFHSHGKNRPVESPVEFSRRNFTDSF